MKDFIKANGFFYSRIILTERWIFEFIEEVTSIGGNYVFLPLAYCGLWHFLQGHEDLLDDAFHHRAFSHDSLHTVAGLTFRNSFQDHLKLGGSGIVVELLVLDVLHCLFPSSQDFLGMSLRPATQVCSIAGPSDRGSAETVEKSWTSQDIKTILVVQTDQVLTPLLQRSLGIL